MNHIRRTIWVAVATLALLPAGAVSATTDIADSVQSVAVDAADLLTQERELVAAAVDNEAARAELRSVDGAGAAAMQQLELLGVDVTEAIRATLTRLPAGPADTGVDQAAPPLDVVYDTAISDLGRIAATPSSFLPDRAESGSATGGLLAVAALALLALGAAALGNILRKNPAAGDLEAMAWSDGLTGVANRRRLDHDIEAREELREQTAVIMLDIDHFKLVNDSFGHSHGDEVLRRVGKMISENIRYDDIVYRYGGEEFCVLLPGATTGEAHEVGQRLVAAAHSIDLPDGSNLTVSLGIAEAPQGDVSTALTAADGALFAAKEQGRDRAVLAVSASHALTPA